MARATYTRNINVGVVLKQYSVSLMKKNTNGMTLCTVGYCEHVIEIEPP